MRWRLANSLRSAYELGLVTQDTFVHRIDRLYGGYRIDPQQLVGDLTFRRRESPWASLARLESWLRGWRHVDRSEPELPILALDWTGATPQVLVGRSPECDLMLDDRSISRRHAQLFFREGRWILIDLESTNGSYINGERVQRAELLPGDVVTIGSEQLRVD